MSKQLKDTATFFLRFWYRNAAGLNQVAQNAPPAMHRFLNENKQLDPHLVHDALVAVATGKVPDDRTIPELMQWFLLNPQATSRIDEVLQQKQRVSSFSHLLNKAYSLERSRITDQVHKFLLSLTTIN